MDNETFLKMCHDFDHRCYGILEQKRLEYSKAGEDRLVHFHLTAESESIPPTEALYQMTTKHLSALRMMVKNPTDYNRHQWLERLGDISNYMRLCWAIVNELTEAHQPAVVGMMKEACDGEER